MLEFEQHKTNKGQPDCFDCLVRKHAICSLCCEEELVKLNNIKTYRTFSKGETITYAGQKITHVGTPVSGIASISQMLVDGRRQIMGILLPGDFIGRPGRHISQFDIVTSSQVMLCRFEIGFFEKLFASSQSLAQRLLEIKMDELDAAREWMLVLGRKSARERIASLFYMIATKAKILKQNSHQKSSDFELLITREELADYLGLTIETVSRQITALTRDGVISIERQRKISVRDLSQLLVETGNDYSGDILN